jgi:hypothetical protein
MSCVVAGAAVLRQDCHFTAIGWARDSVVAGYPASWLGYLASQRRDDSAPAW